MPWKIRKRGSEYCVVKYDGSTVKCHPTRPKALAHMRALYASEGKEMKEEEIKEVESTEELDTKSSYYDEMEDRYKYVPYSVTSFADLEEVEKAQEKTGIISNLLGKFKAIVDNIFYNDEVDDKASAVEKVTTEFNQRLRSTKEIKEAVKNTIESTPGESPINSFSIFKSADGTWKWTAIWSNKYRDDDIPPEILSEAAHLDFVKAVEVDKSYPYQELQLWHYPPITWGDTRHIAYDTDNGVNIACGDIRKGFEPLAEVISAMPPDTVGVSHGMPIAEIQRDPDDNSVIVRYRSSEISVLPKTAAANKLTGFTLLGGTMKLNPEGKERKIKEWIGEDKFAEVAAVADAIGKEATEQALEYKEEKTPEEKKETLTTPETPVASETPEAPEPETKEVDSLDELRKEIVKEVYQPLADAVLAIKDVLVTLNRKVDKLTADDEEKIAAQVKETPRMSLAGIIASSVIGNEDAYVDGRTKDGRDKPKETSPTEVAPFAADMGLFSDIITDIVNGKALGA